MTPLHVHDVVAFVPTRDFAKSRVFYLELGFEQTWGGDGGCGLRIDGHNFILQDFYVKDHAENFMMQLMVEDVNAWWERIQRLGLKEKYQLGMCNPPAMQPWGLLILYITDPTGVLWHIAQMPKG